MNRGSAPEESMDPFKRSRTTRTGLYDTAIFGIGKRKYEGKVFTNLTEKQQEAFDAYFQMDRHENRVFFSDDDYDGKGDFTGRRSQHVHENVKEVTAPVQHATKRMSLARQATGLSAPSEEGSHLLEKTLSLQSSGKKEHSPHHHGHSRHEHEIHEPNVIKAVAAALINYALMYGFSCAYGLIMFADPGNS